MQTKFNWKLFVLLTAFSVLLSGCFYSPSLAPLAEKRGPEKPLLIQNATVFTGKADAGIIENADILIADGRIQKIGDVAGSEKDVVTMDGTGKMVMPGLIDHHIHIGSPGAPPDFSVMPNEDMLARNLSSYLYAGVTTVFDMAGGLEKLEELAERMEEKNRVAPRFFYVGKPLTKAGGHPYYMVDKMVPWPVDRFVIGQLMFQVSEKADIAPAVRQNKAHGAAMTKIMVDQIPLGAPTLHEESIGAIAAASKDAGLPVAAHVGAESDIIACLNGGVPFIAHAPYRSAVSDATIARMKEEGAVVIPTLVVFDNTAAYFENNLAFTPMDKAIMDPVILDAYRNGTEGLVIDDPRMENWIHDLVTYREIKFEAVRKMKAAGIAIIAGSDSPNVATVPGSSLHTEMRLLVEKCGFTPVEAVAAATYEAGRSIERITGARGLGRIAEGGPADLVVLNGDFRDDIRQTQDIDTVIAEGRIVERAGRPGI
ncbi:MAG: amidohydrolase family protein [Thermodesulfobacteriota bacterium]